MAPWKYESGHQKLIKKKIEKLIESQKGALEKFVTSNKQNITEKLCDSSTNEQEIHSNKEFEEEEKKKKKKKAPILNLAWGPQKVWDGPAYPVLTITICWQPLVLFFLLLRIQ